METASRQLHAKFDLAACLFAALGPKEAEPDRAYLVELEAIRARFALTTCHLFIVAAEGRSARAAAQDSFRQAVAAGDFAGDLDRLVGRAAATIPKSTFGREGRAFAEARLLAEQYRRFRLDAPAFAEVVRIEYTLCPGCQAEMVVDADSSELRCVLCAQVRGLEGTVFDDAQFYNQEGQKAKSGTFNPNRHCHFWIDHLLAREPEEELGDRTDPKNLCGEKLLHRLRAIVTRNQLILRFLNVDACRGMLREIKRTDLNKNVPLILLKLTGVGPPQMPETLCQRAEKLFSKAVEIEEDIRAVGRTNRSYYPYYLYKIFDSILPAGDHAHRRVLYYIYLQSQETLNKNDEDWKAICSRMSEVSWSVTSRSAADRYRPQ